MSTSYIFPISIGICVEFFVFTFCYLINYCAKIIPGFNLLTFLVLVALAFLILYYFILQFFPKESRSFYLIFYPLFVCTCFDLSTIFDWWHHPNYWVLSEYFKIKDIVLHGSWGDEGVVINSTLLKFIFYVILCRAWNGNRRSSRSLLIFNTVCMDAWFVVFLLTTMSLNCELTMVSKFFLPSSPFVFISPLLVMLWNKRNFTFDSKQLSARIKTMDKLNAAGIVLSIIIFTVKFLTAIGSTVWPTDLIRSNDPMVLYREVQIKDFIPHGFGVFMTWITMAFIVPSLAINFYYKFQPQKPLFLWDLVLVQTGFILMYQLHYIVGALVPATPAAFRADVGNKAFWIINGIPLVVAPLEMFSLHKHRVKLSDFKESKDKPSKYSHKKMK